MWSFVKRKRSLLIIGVGCCLLLAAILWSRPVQVTYHKHAMELAKKAIYSISRDADGGVDGWHAYGDKATFDRYDFHREKLVKLGYLTHKSYEFTHIIKPTDESGHFTKNLLRGRCPLLIDFSSRYPPIPAPMQLDVWCLPEHEQEWTEFVGSRDVPDYRARFMAPAVTSVEPR